jgi:hypothetical protein
MDILINLEMENKQTLKQKTRYGVGANGFRL